MSDDTEYNKDKMCNCRGHTIDYCLCTPCMKSFWDNYYKYHKERLEREHARKTISEL